MRVTLLAENLAFGGINRYCLDLAEGLRAYPDVNVSLLALGDCSDQWLLQEAAVLGRQVEILPMSGVFDLQVVKRLRCLLIERQVDILHTQGYRGNAIARLAVRLGRLPTKLICTVHGKSQFSSAPLRSRVYYALDYLTISASDHIIPVSVATGQQIAALCRGRPMTAIHNGTRLPNVPTTSTKLASRQLLDIPDGIRVVSFVGRLSPQKGIKTLIDVARRTLDGTVDVVFIVVGDGELRPMVESLAQEYEGRVLLFGAQRDVSVFYDVSDVLLIPSPMEGLPMVLLEALAHGIPVVASKVGGIPEVVINGYNGFLCNPADSDEMHRCILQILSDRTLQQELGYHARLTIESGFSLAHMAEETYRVYLSTGEQATRSTQSQISVD